MGFYILCTCIIYTSRCSSVIRIPMGGVFLCVRGRARVCVARILLLCTERESITKIRWPAINPTRKMLSLFILFFFPIWRTPTTRRDDHTIWSQFGGVVGTSHRRRSIVGVYENPVERKTGARNECGVRMCVCVAYNIVGGMYLYEYTHMLYGFLLLPTRTKCRLKMEIFSSRVYAITVSSSLRPSNRCTMGFFFSRFLFRFFFFFYSSSSRRVIYLLIGLKFLGATPE